MKRVSRMVSWMTFESQQMKERDMQQRDRYHMSLVAVGDQVSRVARRETCVEEVPSGGSGWVCRGPWKGEISHRD